MLGAGDEPYEGEGREVVLRGYSQPVAVQWRDPSVERRRRVRELPWESIEPWRRTAVLRVLTGRAPLLAPAAVHSAAPEVVAERLERRDGWRRMPVEGARNAFVSTVASRRHGEPIVMGADGVSTPARPRSRRTEERTSPSLLGPGLALACLVGVGAVIAARA